MQETSKRVNSQQSTTDAFTQEYCNIQDYFTGSFSLDIAKFNTFSNLLLTLDYMRPTVGIKKSLRSVIVIRL